MNSIRKVIAALMVAVLTVAMASTAAFAAEEQTRSDKLVNIATDALENVKTGRLYSGTVSDPVLVYYGSQPFSQPLAAFKWASSSIKQDDPDYIGSLQDLSVGIVSNLAGFFAANYLSKTVTTLQDTVKDIAEGLENAPDDLNNSVKKIAPVTSNLYTIKTPEGKMLLQATLLPGYLATNAGALAFVLFGGGAALVVIVALSGVLSPLLLLKEGPRVIGQLQRDFAELDQAVDAAN